MGLIEAVAYMTDETTPDVRYPMCCCPVLADFGRSWNDGLLNHERSQLLPYINALIDTRSTSLVELHRRSLAAQWLIREAAPAWLDLAGLNSHAEALRTTTTADFVETTVIEAANAAEAAAWVACSASNPADSTVQDITKTAHLRCAANAAYDAATGTGPAKIIAWRAADKAAVTVAAQASWTGTVDEHFEALHREAVQTALEPTVQYLQQSAHRLFNKMINCL